MLFIFNSSVNGLNGVSYTDHTGSVRCLLDTEWTRRIQRSTHLEELHGHQAEALLFEALDDFSDQASLDAVRFDGDEGALGFGSHSSGTQENLLKDVFSTDDTVLCNQNTRKSQKKVVLGIMRDLLSERSLKYTGTLKCLHFITQVNAA